MTTKSYRPDIDGLRAIAIAAVVLCHARMPGFTGGYVGVDVFFVISGFLITRLIGEDEAFSFIRFYERRARRLLPALLAMLTVATIAAWVILLPREMEFYARELAATGLLVPNVFAWKSSGYFGPEALDLPLLHLWSLGVEEQFYLVFPLVLWLINRYLPVRALPWLIAAAALVSLGLAEILVRRPSTAAFYLLPPRAWELLIGCLLAVVDTRPTGRRTATAVALIGLAMIGYAIYEFDAGTAFPGFAAIPPVLGAAMVIWAGRTEGNAGSRILALPPLVGLGLISYSLYLWHWPLLSFFGLRSDSTPTVLQALVIVIVALPISYISWRWIECPVRRRTFAARPARRLTVALAALVPFAAGGIVLTLAHGFPQRVDPRVLQVNADGQFASALLPPCVRGIVPSQPTMCGHVATSAKRGTVVIWGDSHAEHFSAAIASQLNPLGYTVVLASVRSCPPLIGVSLAILTAGGPVGRKCMKANAAMPAKMASIADLRLVILAARWTAFIPSRRADDTSDRWFTTREGKRASADEARRLFAIGLGAAVQAARSTGAHVLLIDQLPEFTRSPRNCVARALRDELPAASCDRPEAVAPDVRKDIVKIMDARAASGQVTVIHPARTLCRARTCSPVRNGHLLFRDAHHLSVEGARFYAPILRGPVAAALPR
ncbi:acyltransferase family protein [Sphingomonas hylomeconis]|uniref:Acyltransferase family protein n=1 Tax=Sphingomonas hylomeconis TaxID=1395958 RepID=A0ABV7SYG7_9SPHN|nr:acyltransferase family protein [Sphingomonas hylomeconis]